MVSCIQRSLAIILKNNTLGTFLDLRKSLAQDTFHVLFLEKIEMIYADTYITWHSGMRITLLSKSKHDWKFLFMLDTISGFVTLLRLIQTHENSS